MSNDTINLLMVICLCTILLSIIIKLLFWMQAKKAGTRNNPLLFSFFRWFDVYALWDTTNESKKTFMKVSNVLNIFVWLACVVMFFLILR